MLVWKATILFAQVHYYSKQKNNNDVMPLHSEQKKDSGFQDKNVMISVSYQFHWKCYAKSLQSLETSYPYTYEVWI